MALPSKSPHGANETTSFQPATTLEGNESMWSRLFRPFSSPSLTAHRALPKLKAGRLLLEVGVPSEWRQFDTVLAGSSLSDLALFYYTSKTDPVPEGSIPLHSAHVDVLEEVVMVVTHEKTWFLCAEQPRDASDWAEVICSSIEKLSLNGKSDNDPVLGGSSSSRASTGSTTSRRRRRLPSHASHITLREIQSRESHTRVDEFLEIVVRSTAEEIHRQAMDGALSWSCMRSITWKLWLGVLPTDQPLSQWIPITQKKRLAYESRRAGHVLLQGSQQEDDDHVGEEAFIAACDTSDDNTLYNIFKDVRRTRGAMEFFRDTRVQCMLIRILYTYSHAHPEISYNQGMGELLATIVYLLHIEQWPAQTASASSSNSHSSFHAADVTTSSSSTASLSASVNSLKPSSSSGSFVTITPSSSHERFSESDLDDASYVYVDSFVDFQDDAPRLDLDREALLRATPFYGATGKYLDCCKEAAEEIVREMTSVSFLEHDAYLLLEQIMDRMAGAYCPEIHSQSSTAAVSHTSVAAEMASSPLYDQMNRIHTHILARCDPPTARHLSTLGVEPQMFALRWVRVLMAREFAMAQVWQIWDAIFSLTPRDFSFINLLCVAAVREFREEMIAQDEPTGVLLCLRDLSDKVDADRLVENARELYDAMLIAAAVDAANAM